MINQAALTENKLSVFNKRANSVIFPALTSPKSNAEDLKFDFRRNNAAPSFKTPSQQSNSVIK
jgi:hypothetical protein